MYRLAALCAAALLAAALPAPGACARPRPLAPAEGEVIVKFKPGAEAVRAHALAARPGAAAVQEALAGRAAALGARSGHALQAGAPVGERVQLVRARGVDAATLARTLAADPEVEYAVPNGRKRRSTAPNDPLYPAAASGVRPRGPDSGQWYLRAPLDPVRSSIDIEAAWARSTGTGVVVAVLDTGVRPEHPDLAASLLAGYDFISNTATANDGDGRDADPSDPGDWISAADKLLPAFSDPSCFVEDSSWHGTTTASLVAAPTDNGVGMAGSARGAKVLPVRVLGKCGGFDSDIVPAMRWAAGIHVDGVPDNPTPAKIISMSLGGDGACSAAYQDAINEIVARGVSIVIAGGNSDGGPVGEPANCSGAIAVLALRHAGTKVGFSSLGPEIAIAAPGGNCINISAGSPCLYPILAATNAGPTSPTMSGWTDGYNVSTGTSFTTPLVAGVAALMAAVRPDITPALLKARMQSTARPFPTTCVEANCNEPTMPAACHAPSSSVPQRQCVCNTTYCGAGMLDARGAVQAAAGGLARIDIVTAAPVAGSPVTLTAANSLPTAGSTLVGYAWSVTRSGGIVSSTYTSSSAAATLTPSAAGSFTMAVAVSDGVGNTLLAQQTVTVAAAPVEAPVTAPLPPLSNGGGAFSVAWLLLLALGAGILARRKN